MIQLRLKYQEEQFHYSGDIDRIVNVFADRGYEISYSDAGHAWERHSENYAAGWLILPENDDDLYAEISYLFEEVNS